MIFIFVIFSLIYSQDSLNCRQIGYYDTSDKAYGVAVANNYAYVADRNAGLRIIEVYGIGIKESNLSKEKNLTSYIDKETNLLG